MARFRLMKAIATGALRFHAGEVVTDTIPLTVATDRHWPGLTASVMASGMVPLDGSASSRKQRVCGLVKCYRQPFSELIASDRRF